MKSGVLFGYGAMIDGLVKGIRAEMTTDMNEPFGVVATGGMAKFNCTLCTLHRYNRTNAHASRAEDNI